MMQGGFEWLVAWRYLRDPERRVSAWLFIGLVLVALGVGLAWLAHGLPQTDSTNGPVPAALRYGRYVFFGGALLAVFGSWVAIFGACLSAFRLFTTISIFGVFFGTQALIFVLAVMSGFEGNLRRSILGNNAHVVIRKGHKPFPRDPELEKALFDAKGKPRIPDLRAATPFLQDEVILSGPKAHSGVYLKGVDPENHFSRKLVGVNLQAGTVDNLVHPVRLAYLSSAHFPVLPPPTHDPTLDLDDSGLGPALDPDAWPEPKPRTRGEPRPEGGPEREQPPQLRPRAPPETPDGPPREVPEARPRDPAADRSGQGPGSDGDGVPGGPAVPTPDEPPPFLGAHVTGEARVLPGIILGRELAKTLGLGLGDAVDVISTRAPDIIVTGPMPRLMEFRVAGIFYSGHYEFDQKYGYVTLPVAQELLRKENHISGLELHTRSPESAQGVAKRVRESLGARSSYEVRPWQEIHRAIFAALQAEKLAMFVVLVIIVIVAAFSIVANLIMVVAEKSAEISVLRSMGARPRSILLIFVYEGIYIGTIGMAIGVSMGIALSMALRHFGVALNPDVYYIQSIPVAVDPLEVAVVACSVLGISLLAALFPAVRAMGMRPLDGLRFK